MKVSPRFKWLAVLLWVCCIWFMSAHSEPPGDPIGRITHLVQNTIVQPPILPGKSLAFSVQKLGHLWEYCVLGSLLAWALQRQRQGKRLIIPLGVLAASLDETIQRFVPGREGCFRDVCIDTVGLIVGALLLVAVAKIVNDKMQTTSGAKT